MKRPLSPLATLRFVLTCLPLFGWVGPASGAEVKTWDGKHRVDRIDVTVVYFVPRDRTPLPDWKERVHYFCGRIERFHQREFQGQSVLRTTIRAEPFASSRTTEQLRGGDADFTFFQTLNEVDGASHFAQGERQGFPILLVLSDINWRPLDDFFRLKVKEDGSLAFEGNYSEGRHFPGATSGGARAVYLGDRGVGWGLVSGDGWRVPYSGSDCVVYHEGVGHAIGLPHPEAKDGSVMSLGQYSGWISESWLDEAQKKRLGWIPPETPVHRPTDLFSVFRALPEPLVPRPNQPVSLRLNWPAQAQVRSCRIRLQTELFGPWLDVARETAAGSDTVAIGRFDRPTPVAYRVEAVLADGEDVQLWGYFQVRAQPDVCPLPAPADSLSARQFQERPAARRVTPADAVDLLSLVDVERDNVSGAWEKAGAVLVSPKAYGARLELPYQPPDEYELVVIAEPLGEPNGLILGQRLNEHRFLVLVNYTPGASGPLSALENLDGKNVGANLTTVQGVFLAKNRLAELICTVRKDSVTVTCDGRRVLDWSGDPRSLSLSDYWKTPHGARLFLGAYDCRYRFHRVTLTPLSGHGKPIY